MAISPTKLRQDLYSYLDQVIATGEPLEINRNGIKLKIVLGTEEKKDKKQKGESKLSRLKKGRTAGIVGDPEDLVHMDWSKYWKPFL